MASKAVERISVIIDSADFLDEESLAGYAYDDKHSGKHEDGRHDALYPHGTKHAKHDKDATFAYQIVETDRVFTYDDAGKLLSATEKEDNYGTYVYNYEYDLMGNRTAVIKTDENGTVAESEKYVYNESNQLVSVELYDGKKTTSVSYTYDEDGNLISQIGRDGTDKVELYYSYTVEDRLEAVYDKQELLMAAAYDGDGNRVFQLNYNLHTDDDWKGNSGNGNGSNKDNSGSGNGSDNSSNSNSSNGKGNGNSNGNGNASNAETNNSQNQSGILFPIDNQVSDTEEYLISLIKTSGKEMNYELIEYINDVNREYTEVLMEQNINGALDTAYVYGTGRLSLDRFDGSTGYYLYDPRGSVTGITNEEGQIYQSYRYSVTGEITFGAPLYNNEYTYNGESYNPNIKSQYLRARYYYVVTATFLTEDSYLGNITEPLTMNRYLYCLASPLNYVDPSGFYSTTQGDAAHRALQAEFMSRYPLSGKTEFPVTGYPYSDTGKGSVDMVLLTSSGYEVYEIKPYWQMHIYQKEGDALKEYVKYNVDTFLPGWKQREGYITALRSMGKTVNANAASFNPNGWILPIKDAYYDYARYFTVPGQPGMIYYELGKNKLKQPATLPVTVRNIDEMKMLERCKVRHLDSKVGRIVEITTVGSVVANLLETIISVEERAKFFFLPVIPEFFQTPIRGKDAPPEIA